MKKTQEAIVRTVVYGAWAVAGVVSTVWWLITGKYRDADYNPRHWGY